MEELKYGDKTNTYTADKQLQELIAANQASGIQLEIKIDWINKMVILASNGKEILLTIKGARDLAMVLRQAANKLNPRKAQHD